MSPVCPLQLFPDLHCSAAPSKHQSNGDARCQQPCQACCRDNKHLKRKQMSQFRTFDGNKSALSGFCSSPVHPRSKRLRFQSGTPPPSDGKHSETSASLPFYLSSEQTYFTEKACNRISNIRTADCTDQSVCPSGPEEQHSSERSFSSSQEQETSHSEEEGKFTALKQLKHPLVVF